MKKSRRKIQSTGRFRILKNGSVWIHIALLMVLFASIAYLLTPPPVPSLANLQVGEKVWEDIKSNFDFTVVDEATTEKRRQSAESAVLPVYDYDSSLRIRLDQRLTEVFGLWRRRLRERRLRERPDLLVGPPLPPEMARKEKDTELQTLQKDYEDFQKESGLKLSLETFQVLRSMNFSVDVERGVRRILEQVCNYAIVANRNLLLEQASTGITRRDTITKEEKNIYNLDLIISIEEAWREIDAIAARLYPDNQILQDVTAEVARALIRPNLTWNMQETQERRKNARESVKPVFFRVKAGEIIAKSGETVTPEMKVRLDHLNQIRRENRLGLIFIGNFLLVLTLFLVVYFYLSRRRRSVRLDMERIFMIGLVSFLQVLQVMLFMKLASFIPDVFRSYPFNMPEPYAYAVPFAFGTMLIALLADEQIAVIFSFIFGILASIATEGNYLLGIYAMISGYASIFAVSRYKQRTMILQGGLLVSLVNIFTMALLQCIRGDIKLMVLALSGVAALVNGLLLAILVTVLLPVLEWLFKIPTDIRLLELSNFDQPLLKKLARVAPGTHHHSIIVADLAESAAEAIGADALLARVGAYYHDIGKISRPNYFIENIWGKNPHDDLSPFMSAMVIRNHTRVGAELARKHGLGRDIINIIEQHHGTSLLTFFYNKAKELSETDKSIGEVTEDAFRYPGPRPRSKEAAIVLIADSVEAAARSLSSPSATTLKNLVTTITQARFSDHQFDDCDLTFRELTIIADRLYQSLLRNYHARIKYPGYDFEKREHDTESDESGETGRTDENFRLGTTEGEPEE